ncbi:hypothetical protein JW911_03520 [Candidatus Peregrinibacteria bacterium]|nr:hypothetical protein [Candidatus Peregrinibacteria bacterium]
MKIPGFNNFDGLFNHNAHNAHAQVCMHAQPDAHACIFSEKRLVFFAAGGPEGPKPSAPAKKSQEQRNPFIAVDDDDEMQSPYQTKPEQGAERAPATPEKRRERAQERARNAVISATVQQIDNDLAIIKTLEAQKTMDAFLKLAKNQKPTPDQQAALKSYISKINNNQSKTIDRTENGFPIRVIITKSKEGNHFKVNINVGLHPERFKPNVVGENIAKTQSFLDKNGKQIPQPDKKIATFQDSSNLEIKNLIRFANTPAGHMGKLLNNIKLKGKEGFDKAKPDLVKLIEQLKLDTSGMVKTLDLGNGYKLAYGVYKKNNPEDQKAQPDIVMYFMGKAICYRQAGELHYSEANPDQRAVSYKERVAEIRSAHLTMDEALQKVRFRPGTSEPIMSPMTLQQLNWSAFQLAKFNVEYPQRGYWEHSYPGAKATMKYYTRPQDFGSFSFHMPGGTFYLKFSTKTEKVGNQNVRVQDNQIGVRDKNGTLKFKSKDKFLMTPKEAEKARQEYEAAQKARAQAEAKAKPAVKPEANDETRTFNYKYNNRSLTVNPNDKTDLTVNFKNRNIERTTRIEALLNLDQFKDKVVYITITPKKPNAKPRKGMYFRGQNTVFELDDKGIQTNNRIKIFNGDKIKIDKVKAPEKDDYMKVNIEFVDSLIIKNNKLTIELTNLLASRRNKNNSQLKSDHKKTREVITNQLYQKYHLTKVNLSKVSIRKEREYLPLLEDRIKILTDFLLKYKA